jgi:mono/diheme cytochrome c family protein
MPFEKNTSKLVYLIYLLTIVPLLIAANFNDDKTAPSNTMQEGDWKAPSAVNKLVNPIKDISQAIRIGKNLYVAQCSICHGENGAGDGVAGMGLNPRPANLTTNGFQEQSDGAIFWKLTSGRPPMASYAEIFTAEQRWQLVAYLRTLENK